jgi:exonuclease III
MKLEAVTATKSDFIFLSDIRLVNNKGVKGYERVSRYLRDNKNRAYDMYHHSTGNGRGVAILIAISLNVVVNQCWKDQAENAIIMDVTLDDCKLTLGSVYGPNNTGREFYRFLRDTLAVNSNLLEELCTDLTMSDPYRTLYPTRIDFTYSPFGHVRNNRSRIDFFLVTNNLIPMLDECTISNTVTTSLFNHKCISLYIKKKSQQKNRVPKLTNTFLNSKYLDLSVTTAAIEANVLSIDVSCNDNVPANYNSSADLVADMKIKLADLKRIIKEHESLELQKAKSDQNVHLNLLVAAKAASGFLAIENMVPMERLRN